MVIGLMRLIETLVIAKKSLTIWAHILSLRGLLLITRICAAEIRLSLDRMHFVFFLCCIYIEKDIMPIST